MIFKSNRFILTLTFFILFAIGVSVAVVGATEPLPERPIVPVPAVTTTSSPSGSKLILKAPLGVVNSNGDAYDADDWTVVQWQAVNGTWYDVDGWQGNFFFNGDTDPNNWLVEWWVGSENYGKKNFRFVIYTNETREKIKQTSTN